MVQQGQQEAAVGLPRQNSLLQLQFSRCDMAPTKPHETHVIRPVMTTLGGCVGPAEWHGRGKVAIVPNNGMEAHGMP